ncbi:MAG: tripartite tricarboxylate transporter substrate binding protein [Alphaproteobacteria bacterium]|nr:tripartite tricarboxylate transporter substrate binding protein [Alphaproteobacteria bacterium]
MSQPFSRRRLMAGAAAVPAAMIAGAGARPARAQAFPNRPVRVIVPYPAGGGTDLVTRAVAEPMGRRLGQPVVIDNRSGAAGAIGIEAMARSAPDGYTLGVGAPGPITVGPNLRPHPYDPKALTYVTRFVVAPFILVARKDLPASNVAELAALVKSRPDGIRFASAGVGTGTHMSAELFALRAGSRMVHVPYRGTAPAITDLISGQVDIFFSDASAIAHVQGGALKALGVTSAEPWRRLPNIPPIAATLAGYDVSNWYGLMAPTGTPGDVLRRLQEAATAALGEPEVVSRIESIGFEPSPLSGAPFAEFARRELDTWAEVIRHANIKLD